MIPIENTRDAAWLKPLVAMLQPGSVTMIAHETLERLARATREREIQIELEWQRWTRP